MSKEKNDSPKKVEKPVRTTNPNLDGEVRSETKIPKQDDNPDNKGKKRQE